MYKNSLLEYNNSRKIKNNKHNSNLKDNVYVIDAIFDNNICTKWL